MRWLWQKSERREAIGGYTDIIGRLIEAQAAGTTANASATAAVEAASGSLSRAFAAAEVDGPDWAKEAVTGRVLAQIGRDLIRVGESLHVIRYMAGHLVLIPCSTWYFEGDADASTWACTATAYGPSGSSTWRVLWNSVVFASWGSPTARPYHGIGPTGWASETSRLSAETEKSLADEAAGPLAQLIAIPQDGGDDTDDADPLGQLKATIATARGKALLVETTQAGFDQGRVAAPQKDWMANRLGPSPPDAMVAVSKDAFARVLAACGCSPALFDDSDGTSKREALRQWHMGTVRPLARLLETELNAKLETPVRLRFEAYATDLMGRAQAFQKLVAGGVAVNEALITAGLLADDAA